MVASEQARDGDSPMQADTAGGERLQLKLDHAVEPLFARVFVNRDDGRIEVHTLTLVAGSNSVY